MSIQKDSISKMRMKTSRFNKISATLIGCTLIFFLSCSQNEQFIKDCNLCDAVNQKEVETTMNNFLYNDIIGNISDEAKFQLIPEKEILRNGHKFIECGCIDDVVTYHLWCENDKTYQLEVELLDNHGFLIVRIQEAEFSHP